MVSILLLYLNFPPCVPPYNGLRSTSLFNFPPCVPPYNGLHSISLFKLPPFLHSTIQWYPFYFFISISPSAFHHTIVSILMLYLNFPPLRSTIQWSPFYNRVTSDHKGDTVTVCDRRGAPSTLGHLRPDFFMCFHGSKRGNSE